MSTTIYTGMKGKAIPPSLEDLGFTQGGHRARGDRRVEDTPESASASPPLGGSFSVRDSIG